MRYQASAACSIMLRSAAFLLLALPLTAQVGQRHVIPPSSGAKTFYLEKDNEAVRAEPLSLTDDDSKVELRVHISGGTMNRTIALADFTPHSRYRIVEALTPPDDANAQLGLAKFAASLGLTTSADRALNRARSLAGDDKFGDEVANEVKADAAEAKIAEFRKMLERGEIGKADQKLKTIVARYPEQIDARRAKDLQAEVDKARQELEHGREVAAASAAEKKANDERERRLRPLREDLAKGTKEKTQGMNDSKHTGTATRSFESAIRRFERVQKEGDNLIRRHGNDETMVAEVERLQNSARSQQIDTMLSTASMYMLRGQYNPAMGEVNKVLAIDQGNKRALAMRGRIEMTANRGYGW